MTVREHFVIAGGGRVGRRVAEDFANRGHEVTVIEQDPSVVDTGHTGERITYVEGDATRPSLLEETLAERTAVLGALTDSQPVNLAACMTAKQLRPDVETVARIEVKNGDEYTRFVDRVYLPERTSVTAAVNAMAGSDVRSLEGVTGDLELFDIRLDYDAPAASEIVEDTLPEGSLVVSQASGDVAVQHSTRLVAGRRYIIAADYDVVDEVLRQFRGDANI